MNYNTQNAKIASIMEKTLMVGIDVGSETHYTRAFDWRNYEYSKRPFAFKTQEELTRIKNRIARWFSIYFLEIKDVYKTPDSVNGMMVIKKTPLPCDIKELGVVREKVIHGMDSISF